MATDEDAGIPPMPRPGITTNLTPADVCEILATDARREIIEQVAMRGWVSVEDLDADALDALTEHGVIDVRGETAERGENFAGVLETLNERAIERRDGR